MIKVEGLFYYPVKSLGGNAISSGELGVAGLSYDRWWMVTDEEYKFLTQRQVESMALMKAWVQDDLLMLSFAESQYLLSVQQGGSLVGATVWDDQVEAFDMGPAVSEWLTQCLGTWRGSRLRLVRMNDDYRRQVNPQYLGEHDAHTGFADGYPYLITSLSSLEDLNSALKNRGADAVPMSRFRPNIVISGLSAYEEHATQELIHGDYTLGLKKPCQRCKITTIDQDTSEIANPYEPLQTLIKTNPMEGKQGAYFGQNAIVTKGIGATISVGDILEKP
ncbi:MAG: MOSC N-terminal beta barrel domain-containing protein [Pseudomonadota bacterium]